MSWKIVILCIVVVILGLWLMKAPILSRYLTEKIGVPVSIDSVSMRPSRTEIHDFKIKNPHGFSPKEALKAKRTSIDYQFGHLFGAITEIDQIEIDDIFLSIILKNLSGSENNWTAIVEGMPPENSHQREVIIHRLILSNLNVEIRGSKLLKLPPSKHIDRLEFKEVSSKTGFPTKELIKEIFQGAGIDQYIKDLLSPGKLLNPGLIFGENKKSLEMSPGFCTDKN